MYFNIAEALNRGWGTGNASDWYKRDIKASMSFYGLNDATAFLAQPNVKYAGNNTDGLTQILNQKYVSFSKIRDTKHTIIGEERGFQRFWSDLKQPTERKYL